MPAIKLWGFNGSTYVRTVRMVLAEKGVVSYEQVPLNVLEGDTKRPDHMQRHPFGKVPVLDIDGFRVIETPAIARYLDAVLPGQTLVPPDPKGAARMDMAISIIDSYGYGALIGGVAAYHLFPDFVGGKNDEAHRKGLETGRTVIDALMRIKGESLYLAGDGVSIADLYLAPVLAYIMQTPHGEEFLARPGLNAWWTRISQRQSFLVTTP